LALRTLAGIADASCIQRATGDFLNSADKSADSDSSRKKREPYTEQEALIRLVTERTLETLACFRGESAGGGFSHLIGVLVCGAAQETNLFAVAAAPFAQKQMNAQTKPLQRRQRVIERF